MRKLVTAKISSEVVADSIAIHASDGEDTTMSFSVTNPTVKYGSVKKNFLKQASYR